ncbi:MAG: hypothetical protein CL916_12385 [Deltaproteobacteria bacterium]|nr:hypothetical protein [Deltaproteobacteria bacterium]
MLWLLSCTSPDIEDSGQESIEAFAAPLENTYIQIHEPIIFDVEESTGVDFLWDFGDGNQGSGESVAHTYTTPGIYPVVLTVIGSNGLQKSTTQKVTAHNPLLSSAPQISSNITIHDGNIWALFPEAGTLHKINLSSQEQHNFSICLYPKQLMAYSDYLAVTCLDSIAVFHLPTNTIETISLPIGSHPFGIAGEYNNWWVTLSGTGEIAHWDGEIWTYTPVGTDLRTLTKHEQNLYTPRWRSGTQGGEVYHLSPDGVTPHILEIDTAGDSDNTTGGIPNLLSSVTLSPDGTQFVIPMLHANILRGTYRSEEALKHDNTVRAMLATLTSDVQERVETRKHFDEKGRSSAAAFSPFGDRIYIVHPGVQNTSVLNAYTGQFLGTIHDTGVGSQGIAISENLIVIHSHLTREIKVYQNQAPYSMLWSQSFNVEDPLSPQQLLGKQIFNDASDPRITKAGYISCAHCHPDADHDGQTWDFTDRGEGLRNTTSLIARGGTDMGRLHWSGNFDEIQDFEHDMREHFGGSGFLTDEEYDTHDTPLGSAKAGLSTELDALSAYLSSLVDATPSPYTSTQEEEEAFLNAGCAQCHPSPLYTDSNLDNPIRHDIGTIHTSTGMRLYETIDGLDTPSLIGLWSSPPYLHDGSAQTIKEAIQAHHDTQTLTEEQLNLIIHFVQSL